MTRLDELIWEHARPSEILDFLAMSGDVKDLFSESMFFQRLFQLDFFLSCGKAEADRLFGFAEILPARDKSLFSMQVLLSESAKAHYAQYKHRRALRGMASAFGAFNPYVYLTGETADRIRSLDASAVAAAMSKDMLSLPDMLAPEDLDFFLGNIGYSLFQNRVAQLDFLSALSRPRQAVLVGGVFKTLAPSYYVRFVKSILASALDFGIKAAAIDLMKSVGLAFSSASGRPYNELLAECSSFQELVLKDSVTGAGELSKNFELHLLLHSPENLRVWLDSYGELPPYLRPDDVDRLISYSMTGKDERG